TTITTKWPQVNLGNIVDVLIGGTPARKNPAYFTGNNPWVSISEMAGGLITETKEKITDKAVKESNVKLIPKGTTLLSFKLSIGKTAIAGCDLYTNEAIAGLIPKDNKVVLNEYLFQIFNSGHINLDVKGLNAFGKSLNSKILREEVIVPLPPINEQKAFVAECKKIDAGVDRAKTNIANTFAAIISDVDAIYASSAPRIEIAKLSTNIQYGINEKMNEAGIGYKIFRMNEIIQGRMVDNGAMKCADISAEEFAKYRLNKGDLLFNRTNSIEHVGKTGLFDLDGDYCFASYLVRVVPDTSKILPLFLVKMMNSPAYQAEAKGKASKSINQANINATVMKNIKVPVPSLAEQKKFVAKVEALEKQIADAQAVIDATPARKEAVMKKYL
ncbi:MAG: restriction endonuclease subunit S, partial [Anaerolineae bacterium]|nr:restriction endonuclease subunit S [Anaerolineae bacterium]